MTEGVHRIELPLPFSLGSINVYLIRLADGYLLLDCGMDTEECFAALDCARLSLEIEWTDIRQILLTHVHPDHMGLAPRLLELTDARLAMHPSDAALLAELAEPANGTRVDHELAAAGTPPALLLEIDDAFAEVSRHFQRLSPDTFLQGGEHIPVAGGELEVLWTPGHSPGHLCLYDRARRILFSGDHILENISPNIAWQPEDDPLSAYLNSLEAIAKLDVDLILPSHGMPFRGHIEWIANALAHHRERCERIIDALDGVKKTAHELVADLWTRSLSPFHYRFAIYEVLAHLEYLRKRGAVVDERHDVVRWHRVPEIAQPITTTS